MKLAVMQVHDALKRTIGNGSFDVQSARSEFDAINIDKGDCVFIQCKGVQLKAMEGNCSSLAHTATFWLECVAREGLADDKQSEAASIVSQVHAALSADYTLGGLVQDITPVNIGEYIPNGREFGSFTLEYDVTYWTPYNDLNTILN